MPMKALSLCQLWKPRIAKLPTHLRLCPWAAPHGQRTLDTQTGRRVDRSALSIDWPFIPPANSLHPDGKDFANQDHQAFGKNAPSQKRACAEGVSWTPRGFRLDEIIGDSDSVIELSPSSLASFSPSLGHGPTDCHTLGGPPLRRQLERPPPPANGHTIAARARPHLSKTTPRARVHSNIRGRTSGRRSRPGASPRAGGAGKRPPCRGSAAARAAASRARPRRSRPVAKHNRGAGLGEPAVRLVQGGKACPGLPQASRPIGRWVRRAGRPRIGTHGSRHRMAQPSRRRAAVRRVARAPGRSTPRNRRLWPGGRRLPLRPLLQATVHSASRSPHGRPRRAGMASCGAPETTLRPCSGASTRGLHCRMPGFLAHTSPACSLPMSSTSTA